MFWENIMALWLCVLIFLFQFPLIGPGGWQHPHLCPSIFKSLAGKGRPITEGGQSSKCLFGSGGAVKAGEAAPATHPSPLELGSRGEVDQGVAPLGVGSCLSFIPGGDPQCRVPHESVWKKGLELVHICYSHLVSCSHLGSQLYSRIAFSTSP